MRPDKVFYSYTVKNADGNIVHKSRDSFDNKAGETFDRVPKSTIKKMLGQ